MYASYACICMCVVAARLPLSLCVRACVRAHKCDVLQVCWRLYHHLLEMLVTHRCVAMWCESFLPLLNQVGFHGL